MSETRRNTVPVGRVENERDCRSGTGQGRRTRRSARMGLQRQKRLLFSATLVRGGVSLRVCYPSVTSACAATHTLPGLPLHRLPGPLGVGCWPKHAQAAVCLVGGCFIPPLKHSRDGVTCCYQNRQKLGAPNSCSNSSPLLSSHRQVLWKRTKVPSSYPSLYIFLFLLFPLSPLPLPSFFLLFLCPSFFNSSIRTLIWSPGAHLCTNNVGAIKRELPFLSPPCATW